MKLLITGSRGQLGTELQRQIAEMGCSLGKLPDIYGIVSLTAVDIDELDLTDRGAVFEFVLSGGYNAVINCAAFTNVDGCEADPETAFAANALGPRHLAEACEAAGTKLLHLSTDYVFAGDASAPYSEADLPAPNTQYGKTKLLGEQYVREICSRYFIVRTAWLYGLVGNNFVKTILHLAREKGEIKVVNDQFGNPTSAIDLAYHVLRLAVSERYGVYHCTNNGVCSWYDFAAEFVRLAGVSATVSPCTTAEFPRPAPRPAFSALENRMLTLTIGDEMRPWQAAIKDYIEQLEAQQ